MRVLIIDPGMKLWGSERALLATIPSLAQAHETIVLMAPSGAEIWTQPEARFATPHPAPIFNLHRSGAFAKLKAAAAIFWACRRHNISKVYLNQAGLCRIVHVITRALSLPLAIHVRLVEDIPRCARLRAAPTVPVDLVFVSDDMRMKYQREGDQNLRAVTAYDPYVLAPVSAAPEGRSKSFVCVGRISEHKGQATLIEALSFLNSSGLTVEADILGAANPSDPFSDLLKDQIAARGIQARVNFLGYRRDVADLMRSYRFSVIPSRYESLGRVVMEAWDAGALPICSRDSGGAAEIVTKSGGGLLYDGHDPTALAAAMQTALAMPEADRLARVQHGRNWVVANMSLERYRDALEGVLYPVSMRDPISSETKGVSSHEVFDNAR